MEMETLNGRLIQRMTNIPSDLQILECIYRTYAGDFANSSKDHSTRSSKIYVPIDIDYVADKLKTDGHGLFGRLYYDLDHRYRYRQDNDSVVHLFALQAGSDPHCINYPYLAGVLSGMRVEDKRNRWSLWLSLVSLGVAIAALIV
ncbi:MAG TPA: hypothetical protein VFQ39_17410 [Longimicrobium sp.]|nr:hypothetical protein [Longimicrobium sp.]